MKSNIIKMIAIALSYSIMFNNSACAKTLISDELNMTKSFILSNESSCELFDTNGNGEINVFDLIRYKSSIIYESKIIKHEKWYGYKWVCIGDSLTELNSRTSVHYFDYISKKTDITVVNMGKSGTGYKRRDDEELAFYQRVKDIPLDADVITIFGSGNDMGANVPLGTASDVGTNTLCGCINTTIDNIIELKPDVVLGIVSPTPWVNYPPNTENAMSKYSDALKEICEMRSIPFLDLYRCSNLRPWTEEGRLNFYTHDNGNGVHPNERGHEIIASKFYNFLESLII